MLGVLETTPTFRDSPERLRAFSLIVLLSAQIYHSDVIRIHSGIIMGKSTGQGISGGAFVWAF